MLLWIISGLVGLVLAVLLYGWRDARGIVQAAPLILLRAIAFTVLVALILDAPAGPAHPSPPLVALDASQSWLRTGDSASWKRAVQMARTASRDSLLLFGDSIRRSRIPSLPTDASTRVSPLVDNALGAGRPLVLITDGVIDDPAALRTLPAGSRVDIVPAPPRRDVAVISLDAPRAAVSGDTLDVRVMIRNGATAAPAGTLTMLAGSRTLASVPVDSLAPFVERSVSVRVPFAAPPGPTVFAAVVTVPGDMERRNDTVAVPLEVSRAAGAVLVSSSPDFDSRFLLPVLRGAVALPTRAYFRVAPNEWRQDGSLAPVREEDVRAALRDAPLAILHGDTAVFGPPRSVTRASLALLAPPADTGGEWYPIAAPPSPIAGTLTGLEWDSLPPIDVAARLPQGEWEGLVAARARQFDRRTAITGDIENGRRVVVVGASGLWRWEFRGGADADAYAALWGSIFDWLAAERPDVRAAIPAEGMVRAGQRIRWRRGSGSDSVVTAVLTRRGDAARSDSVMLRFGKNGSVAESDPLPPGIYDVRVPRGAAVIAVNASRELLPMPATVQSGAIGGAIVAGVQPLLRDRGWAYLLVLAVLCVEWLGRRRKGLR
ncbi:MAG TPA: hypothetical protein VFJ96_08260 [Gemmatimonadaceae bacterium]|nr:hypothetical protein [Gemmatimonadaceae bacterium]